jgi:uncharacterized protein (DUF2267 family)
MPTLTTAAHDLKPGDVLLEPLPSPVGGAASYVVLDLAIATPGPVGVQLARLGTLPAHLDRVATVSWPADAVLEVLRSRPTAEQAATASALLAEGTRAVGLGQWDASMHPARHEARAVLELRQAVALGLLQDVERLAAGGHAAHVRLVHDEIQVSSADVHASVARALEETRVKAWHALVEERDNLAAELLELRNCAA